MKTQPEFPTNATLGMSLLDYFAGQALVQLMAEFKLLRTKAAGQWCDGDWSDVLRNTDADALADEKQCQVLAVAAYRIADAMMDERSEHEH